MEAKSSAQSWDGASHAEAISYGIWGCRGVPAVGKQKGTLPPLLVDGPAGTGPAASQAPWLNRSGTLRELLWLKEPVLLNGARLGWAFSSPKFPLAEVAKPDACPCSSHSHWDQPAPCASLCG